LSAWQEQRELAKGSLIVRLEMDRLQVTDVLLAGNFR
jgi:hypothetical protein